MTALNYLLHCILLYYKLLVVCWFLLFMNYESSAIGAVKLDSLGESGLD